MTVAAPSTEITYQREWFIKIMPELPALFLKHYDEIALDKNKMELDPAWIQYVNLESAGVLHVLTMRVDGVLAGYYFNLVYPHLHYSKILCSFGDMFFIDKKYRTPWRYVKLFVENEKFLRSIGTKKVFVMTKVHRDFRPVMKRLKYRFIERIFSKWIGD